MRQRAGDNRLTFTSCRSARAGRSARGRARSVSAPYGSSKSASSRVGVLLEDPDLGHEAVAEGEQLDDVHRGRAAGGGPDRAHAAEGEGRSAGFGDANRARADLRERPADRLGGAGHDRYRLGRGEGGIGKAIAISFAEAGASVHIIEVDRKNAEETTKQIVQAGGSACWSLCDVSNQQQVKEVFGKLASSGPINILVNNAGVSHIGRLENTPEEEFDRVYRINVKGVYNCMYAAVDSMKAAGGGVILNLASIAGLAGLADRFAYSMSKGAVLTMTYSVARDYVNHNIRCNCISPARVHTPFVDGFLHKNYPGREQEMMQKLSQLQPIGRMGQPEDVAAAVLFLCSDEASYVTGQVLRVNGGMYV